MPDPGDLIPLRVYIERIFDERQKALDVAFKAQDEALRLASRNLELRLEKLNELRQEVTQDRGEYVKREVFDQSIKALVERTDQRLAALENFRSKAAGVAVVLTLIAGVIGAAILKVFS